MTVWYTARGAGLAALLMLTLATSLGALGSIKGARPDNRVLVQYLHRTAAALGLGLLVVHITAILVDADAGVGVTGAIVPFASGYRPGSVAFGSLALYTFLLVSALGAARGRIAGSARGARIWRGLHLLSYLGWAMAMYHGFFTGTDSDLTWVRSLYVLSILSVGTAVAVRLTGLAHSGQIRRAMQLTDQRQLQGASR
jgi:methionine sulfoxide reductase heme-binding subunit